MLVGHSARKCEYGKYSFVLQCGEKKFHPGELNMKEMRCQIKRHQSELNKLVEEFESKKSAVEGWKTKYKAALKVICSKSEQGGIPCERQQKLVIIT